MNTDNAMHRAVKEDDIKKLRILERTHTKEEMISMASEMSNGLTPFHIACRRGQYEIAEYMLDKSYADLQKPSEFLVQHSMTNDTIWNEYDEQTPLYLATSRGHFDVVKLLVCKGANINCVTKFEGLTPVHVACRMGILEVVQYLVDKGADVEIADIAGATCLIKACQRGFVDLVAFLLAAKANVWTRVPSTGNTALHECCYTYYPNNVELFMMLLRHGASFYVKNIYGVTPLQQAAIEGKQSMITALLKKPHFVPRSVKIDTLEILGATTIFETNLLAPTLRYWKKALKYREVYPEIPKPVVLEVPSVYGNAREFRDKIELTSMSINDLKIQALLILERALTPANPFTMKCLLMYGRYRHEMHRTFNDYLEYCHYSLDTQLEHLPPLDPSIKETLQEFPPLFASMINQETIPVIVTELLRIFTKTIRVLNLGGRLNTSLKKEQIKELTCILNISLGLAILLIHMTKDEQDISFKLHQGGAHMDVTNKEGRTFMDYLSPRNYAYMTKIYYNGKNVKLTCLTTRVIKKYNISYEGLLPRQLEDFVDLH